MTAAGTAATTTKRKIGGQSPRTTKSTPAKANNANGNGNTGTIARAKKGAGDAIAKGANAVGRIVKGCVVVWNQRTRTGEKQYEGIVQSGRDAKGRRTVKLIANDTTMQPMDKWLEYKGPAPAANA